MEGNFTADKNDFIIPNYEIISSKESTKNFSNNTNENSTVNSKFSMKISEIKLENSSSSFENGKHFLENINGSKNNNLDCKEESNYYNDIKEEDNKDFNKNENQQNTNIEIKNSDPSNESYDNSIYNNDNKINNSNNNCILKDEKEDENMTPINDKKNDTKQKKMYNLQNMEKSLAKKMFQKKLKQLYKRIDSCSSLLWSHDNHITGKRLRSENDQEDNKLNWKNRETTQTGYGEIALGSMTSLLNLFQNISKLIEYNSHKSHEFESLLIYGPEEYNMTQDSAFLDIGSGFGKPVFHSALQVGCYSKGVEVVPARVEFCLDFFYEYLNEKNFFGEIEEKFLAELNNHNNYDENEHNINNCNIGKSKSASFNSGTVDIKNSYNDNGNDIDLDIDNGTNRDSTDKSHFFNGKGSDSFLNKEDEEMNLNMEENKIYLEENQAENDKMQIEKQCVSSEDSQSGNKKAKFIEEELEKQSQADIIINNNSKNDDEIMENNKTENFNSKTTTIDALVIAKDTNNRAAEEATAGADRDFSSLDKLDNNSIHNINNNNKPTSHSERTIMFHELKKISGDSYLNSLDYNMAYSQRNLRKKKVDYFDSTQISSTITNTKSNKQSKKKSNGFTDNNNTNNKHHTAIKLELKNAVKLNDLNGKYYKEVLKDKTPWFLELKINAEIIYEDSFIEQIANKSNSLLYSQNKNYFFRERNFSEAGILFPEFSEENIFSFGNHFFLNEITIEITAINHLLHENVLKLINNCIFADSLENAIARSLCVFHENLKVDFNEITNKIENFYVLDLIHMTNTYFYVGKKNLNINKLQEIIKKSIKDSAPDILEYCADYLILNKAKFPFLLLNNNNDDNKDLDLNLVNLNNLILTNQFDNVDVINETIRNVRLAGLFSKEAEWKKSVNGEKAKGRGKGGKSNSKSKDSSKIKDLYQELEKQLKNKNLDSCVNYDNISYNYYLNKTHKNDTNSIADNTDNNNSQINCQQIAGISEENYIEEISEKKIVEDKINELANDTKVLKEILVDFKYYYIDDWAKKLVFVSEDATKCKAYIADKKRHFSHIYSYNKLMSKECRSKIAKILNKTKFKVLAWYSNPKQTKKAGLKNFTFISKFPMQSTSTEKFHVYVYIKTK